MTIFAKSAKRVLYLVSIVTGIAGCLSQADDPNHESTESAADAIIGGVAADAPSLNAVGSLVTIQRYSYGTTETVYYGQPFCSATLIGPRAVLTAKHCTQAYGPTQEIGFAVGPDGTRPQKVIAVVEFDVESTIDGGQIQEGSDVAVLHLEASVDGVEPFTYGVLTSDDIGRRFTAVGYGTRDVNGAAGARRAGSLTLRGTSGKVYELAFGSFDAFKVHVPQMADLTYIVGDVKTPDGEARARQIYDTELLLSGGYEAFLGNAPGDAQTCHGDSGGPILRRISGKNTVFGVTSWGHHSTFGYDFCDFGGVFATFGPAAQAFISKAVTWVDPCEGETASGRCDGDIVVRCSVKAEGTRRVLRAECGELGLTCGIGTDGKVGCVDP